MALLIYIDNRGFTRNKKRAKRVKLDKSNTLIVPLDIKNAFNSSNPVVLTKKLEEYKCYSNLFKITHSLLTRRKILCESDNIKVIKPLDMDSPEGTPVSPIY